MTLEMDEKDTQLAQMSAVIARVRDRAVAKGDSYLLRILDAAPESVLAAHDAETVRKVIDYLEADIDWPNIGFIVSGIAKHFGLVPDEKKD